MLSEIEMIEDNVQNTEESSSNSHTNEISTEELDDTIWQQKEQQHLNKLAEYETALKLERQKNAALQKECQAQAEEKDHLKKEIVKLEQDRAKNSLKGKGGQNKDANSSDMVTKAKSVIFEKTKMCKNQELQIEALTQQVKSLKEIVAISKDMLEIRNMEVKQLQDKLECMELKFTAEKDRHALMHTKLDRMITLNAELKQEYEKQLRLFSELQRAYKQHQETTQIINQNQCNGDSA